MSSPTYEVEFVRANPSRPALILGLRYNDRDPWLPDLLICRPELASTCLNALR